MNSGKIRNIIQEAGQGVDIIFLFISLTKLNVFLYFYY